MLIYMMSAFYRQINNKTFILENQKKKITPSKNKKIVIFKKTPTIINFHLNFSLPN